MLYVPHWWEDHYPQVIEAMGHPPALTIPLLWDASPVEFKRYLSDQKSSSTIPKLLREADYIRFKNPNDRRGRWNTSDGRQYIYVKKSLSENEQRQAAGEIQWR